MKRDKDKKHKNEKNIAESADKRGDIGQEETVAAQADAVDADMVKDEEDEEGGWKEFFRFTKEDFRTVVITAIAAILLVQFVAQPVVVDGHSMDDTLHHGERLLIEKITRYYGGLNRYDIIVLDPNNAEGSLYIKRIIGLPGEKIRIDLDGNIYINEKLLEDDIYGRETILDPGRAYEGITLDEDEYFVMGDNRNESLDSRFEEVGNVKQKQIVGKVMIQLFPFHKVK